MMYPERTSFLGLPTGNAWAWKGAISDCATAAGCFHRQYPDRRGQRDGVVYTMHSGRRLYAWRTEGGAVHVRVLAPDNDTDGDP